MRIRAAEENVNVLWPDEVQKTQPRNIGRGRRKKEDVLWMPHSIIAESQRSNFELTNEVIET